jgi:hypothetical protein
MRSNDLNDLLIAGWTIAHPVFPRARCPLRDPDERFGLKSIFFVITGHGEKLEKVRASQLRALPAAMAAAALD